MILLTLRRVLIANIKTLYLVSTSMVFLLLLTNVWVSFLFWEGAWSGEYISLLMPLIISKPIISVLAVATIPMISVCRYTSKLHSSSSRKTLIIYTPALICVMSSLVIVYNFILSYILLYFQVLNSKPTLAKRISHTQYLRMIRIDSPKTLGRYSYFSLHLTYGTPKAYGTSESYSHQKENPHEKQVQKNHHCWLRAIIAQFISTGIH